MQNEHVSPTDSANSTRLEFADKAESALRTVLVVLGYENADKVTPADLITSVVAWASMLRYAKLDPFGRYAAIWWEAAKLIFTTHHISIVEERATEAMNAFVRMFPPTISDDESEHDTINDLAALSKDLDVQTEIAAALLSERDALLRANEHHASELAMVRNELERLQHNLTVSNNHCSMANRDLTAMTLKFDNAVKLHAKEAELRAVALVPLAKPERIEPGQRWAFVMTCTEAQLGTIASFDDASGYQYTAFSKDIEAAHYLGTDKV